MEVMDLSIRKHHPIPSYAHSSYAIGHIPMYAYPPPTLIQTSLQPSVSHLGLFQHLHYAAAPQSILVPDQTHERSPVSHENPVPMHPVSASELPSDKELENGYKIPLPLPAKRPFKTLPSVKSGTLGLVSALDPALEAEYEEYRKQVLSRISHDDSNATNRNMRRNIPSNPEKCKDPEYLEKRRKNNQAARKSREARKAKEDELAIRVAFLEKENLRMKFQLAAIEREKKMILMRRRQL